MESPRSWIPREEFIQRGIGKALTTGKPPNRDRARKADSETQDLTLAQFTLPRPGQPNVRCVVSNESLHAIVIGFLAYLSGATELTAGQDRVPREFS